MRHRHLQVSRSTYQGTRQLRRGRHCTVGSLVLGFLWSQQLRGLNEQGHRTGSFGLRRCEAGLPVRRDALVVQECVARP